jgi:type IV secretion system protein VirD4
MAPWLPRMSTAVQHVARPLMTPGEVSQLPEENEIVFVAGHPPIWARKVKYYNDRNFKTRLLEAPEKSDVIASLPAATDYTVEPAARNEDKLIANPQSDKGDPEFFNGSQHDCIHGHDRTDPSHSDHPGSAITEDANDFQDYTPEEINSNTGTAALERSTDFDIM